MSQVSLIFTGLAASRCEGFGNKITRNGSDSPRITDVPKVGKTEILIRFTEALILSQKWAN